MKTTNKKSGETPRQIISDKTVLLQSGQTTEYWFQKLDAAGALKLNMPEIYSLIQTIPGLEKMSEWNRNLLATRYGWDREIREKGQKKNGFEISVSKTISVPCELLFDYWNTATLRHSWLPEKMSIRKATPAKSLRITWEEDETSLSVELYNKGEHKSQVVVQHLHLPNAEKAEAQKNFWTLRLLELKRLAET